VFQAPLGGTTLEALAQLPRRTSSSRLAATSVATVNDGTIKRVEPIPGGVAVLVSSRVRGQGWDTAPRVILVHGTTTETETPPLPAAGLSCSRSPSRGRS